MTRRVATALLTVLGIVGPVGCASSAAAPAATPTVHAARCLPDALAVRLVNPSGGGATGEHAVELLVVNTGSTPCLVEGYPRVRLRGMADLAVRYVDGQSQYMSSQSPRPVELAPKATG